MKKFETFDDFLDATEELLFTDGEDWGCPRGWNACYARMEKLVETEKEIKKLKDELDESNDKTIELIDERKKIRTENKKLTEEIKEIWQKGYDEGELENSVDQEFLDEKDKEIKALREENEALNSRHADNILQERKSFLELSERMGKRQTEIWKLRDEQLYYKNKHFKLKEENECNRKVLTEQALQHCKRADIYKAELEKYTNDVEQFLQTND